MVADDGVDAADDGESEYELSEELDMALGVQRPSLERRVGMVMDEDILAVK